MMPKEFFFFHQISSNLQRKFYFATHLSGREYPFLCSGGRHLGYLHSTKALNWYILNKQYVHVCC